MRWEATELSLNRGEVPGQTSKLPKYWFDNWQKLREKELGLKEWRQISNRPMLNRCQRVQS